MMTTRKKRRDAGTKLRACYGPVDPEDAMVMLTVSHQKQFKERLGYHGTRARETGPLAGCDVT